MPEGDPNNDPAQGQGGQPPASPPAGTGARTFTQEELNAIDAETRRKAADAERARLLKDLGVDDVDSIKQIIADRKAADDAAKTELQRAQDAQAAAEARASEAETRASLTLVTSELRGALRDAGINPERINGAVRLADLSEVTVQDGQVAGMDKVVAAVKEATPEWFGAPSKTHSAPDASQGGGGSAPFSYRDATPEQKAQALRDLHIRPAYAGIRR